MTTNRRQVLAGLSSILALGVSPGAVLSQQARPLPTPPVVVQQSRFGYEDVVRRARELSGAGFEAGHGLPEPLTRLDFDAWREIRFRPERSLLSAPNAPFQMQMFHPGHLFTRPVTVNVVRDGVPTPVPYAASMFDYGRTKFEKPLPVNLGFAGFRLHWALNDPRVMDELKTTFASSYTSEVSLAGMLHPDSIAVYNKRATGEKVLVTPHKGL